jgi:membrane protein
MPAASPSAVQRPPSMWKLGGLSPWQLARKVIDDVTENQLFERASGLAFDFLFALLPLLFILLAVFSLSASHSAQLRNSLLAYFADFLPAMASQLLDRVADELAGNTSGEKLVIGFVLGLWFNSGGVAAMISSLNAAYRLRESRSWLKVRGIALALALAISILLILALGLVMVSGDVFDWIGNEFQMASAMVAISKALQWPTAMLFVLLSDGLILRFGPDRPAKQWQWFTPGTVFAATLWMAASLGFRFYLRYVNNYPVIFGSLGAAAILLVWLYVSGLSFLIGGEINASIERATAEVSPQAE